MITIPPDIEGIPISIEFEGVDETHLAELKTLFNAQDEQVVFSHAFGGKDALILVATLGKQTLEKLIAFWPKMKASAPKTTLKIDKSSIALQGFTAQEVEALLASPSFAKAVRMNPKR